MNVNRLSLGAALVFAALSGDTACGQGGWTLTTAPLTNWSGVACSADGSNVVAVVGGWTSYYYNPQAPGPIYRSGNSGKTWEMAAAPVTNWSVVAASAQGTNWVAGWLYRSPVQLSTNGGLDWFESGSPNTNIWIAMASSADGNTLMASDPGGGHVPGCVMTSLDSGAHWTWSLHDFTAWTSIACSANGRVMVASSDSRGFYSSTNYGQDWFMTNNPIGPYYTPWPLVVLSADGSKLVSTFAGGGIYISTNLGATWLTTSAPSTNWNALACSADAEIIIAAAGSRDGAIGPIYVSDNGGLSWTTANLPLASWASVASSADGSQQYAAAMGGIYRVQTVPRPKLSIAQSGSSLVLSWLIPSTTFRVQQSPDLSGSTWADVTAAPTLNLTNLHEELLLPLPSTPRFYRLIGQAN
jgi:hypothetical protein